MLHLLLLLLAPAAQAWTLPFFSWPQVEEVAVKHPYQTSFQSSHLLRRAGKALPEPSSDFPRGLRHAARTQHYSVGSSDQSSRQASSRAIFNSRLRTSNLSPSLRAPPRPAPARRQRLLNQAQAAPAQLRTPRLQNSLRRAESGHSSHQGVHQDAPGVQGRIVYNRQRPSRKIASTPLKLGKKQIKKTKKPVEKLVKKHEEKLAEKDDNLAVESNVVVTKVKPGKSVATPKKSEPSKPKVEKKAAAADRAAYGAPAPKFIIKQAGPSQTFGWVGPGRYAPLNIPNIFKAAGINTKWIAEDNEIFEAGLTYPAPSEKKALDVSDSSASSSHHVEHSTPSQKVKKAVNPANYNSPNAPAAIPPKYKKPSSPAKATYKKPKYEAPAPAPAYEAPVKQTYKAPKKNRGKLTYKVASPKDPVKPSFEAPALPPSYQGPKKASKPVSFPTLNSQLTDSFPSGSQNSYSASNKVVPSPKPTTTTPRPVYRAPSTTTATTTPTTTTAAASTTASTTTRSPYTYKASAVPSVTPSFLGSPTPRPFYGSPTPYYTRAPSYGSPTPTPYTYAPAPQPAYYQPAPASVYNSQPSAPFTSFAEVNGKFAEVENKQAPVAAVIETAAEKGGDDDGEVFYIFYENEETLDKGVKSGLDLQRYIHEEVGAGSTDSQYSTSVPQGDLFADENSVPVFSIVEEAKAGQEKLPKKLTQPVYYDIPIKVEESGEGFDPPTEIRTIFVPIENAINIPETFDINLGTSFGYNRKKNNQAGFPNFPSFGAGASSYDSPISSYDAPIAPSSSQGTVSNASPLDQAPKKVIRKARKPSVLKPGFAYDPAHSSVPFGTRLGPRDQYDPLVLRR